MPRVVLRVSAALENVVLLEPLGGSDDQQMNYFFKLNCEQCGWVSEEEVCVNMAIHEKRPGGSRRNSHVNLSTTCDGCERRGTISLIPGHGRPLKEHDCKDVPLMVFDCDGIFPVEYSFNGGWSAITTSGTNIQLNLVAARGYNNVIEGEHIRIYDVKAKFEPYHD